MLCVLCFPSLQGAMSPASGHLPQPVPPPGCRSVLWPKAHRPGRSQVLGPHTRSHAQFCACSHSISILRVSTLYPVLQRWAGTF